MRIGLVIDAYDPAGGGAERWTAQFHAHLRRSGHEVHVITFHAAPDHDVENLHVIPDPGTLLGRANAVAQALAALPPMVVHDNGTGWSADVFHPQTGSRLLSMDRVLAAAAPRERLRNRLSPRMAVLRWQMARIEHRAARRATHVVAVSRSLRALLTRRHGLAEHRVAVIPNGVDTARFAPERLAPLRAAQREALGAGDSLVLLMVAHNLRLKGVDTAIRALAGLRAAGMPARLVVAGGLPDASWHALVAGLGLADAVAFLGDVAEVEALYAAADIFLHPTRWDACSLATIEALAAGLPVITTSVNGASDLITGGVDGLVMADPEDHESLVRHLRGLSSSTLRRRMGEAAARTGARADIGTNCRAVEALLIEADEERIEAHG